MKAPSIKNRIAFYNLAGAAALVLVVFLVIYRIVSASVNYDINSDLQIEIDRHMAYVAGQPEFKNFMPDNEWDESEHKEIIINPVFVQIFDASGNSVEKSPNLKDEGLAFKKDGGDSYFDTAVEGIAIRQQMAPLVNKGATKGYVIIAMSVELPRRVLDNLLTVLLMAYPVVLLLLFGLTRFIAGKSIAPVLNIINTTKRITQNNLNERIALPKNKDELYTLATAINALLERIENAILREKQFTSDASHELRTPLAIIKGTLEVLIRKPRQTDEYEARIKECIAEVNRLTGIAEQLLLLARFEERTAVANRRQVAVDEIILQAMERSSSEIATKKLEIDFKFEDHFYAVTDAAMLGIIIENLLGNAVKYSFDGGSIAILLTQQPESLSCVITDTGRGIAEADLARVYEHFYRSAADEHNAIKGTGLGLSIVKRLSGLLGITVTIDSKKGTGTTVRLLIPVGGN